MENPIMLQTFYWEMNTGRYADEFPEESELWNLLADRAEEFKKTGFDFLWFPPANKGAAGALDVGYGTYDLWDLGEFEQKGNIRTKYGKKAELENTLTKLHFPGRKGKYSSLRLDWTNFDGVDWNERSDEEGEFLFKHKNWDNSFEDDYLMGADLDYENQAVREDVINWGLWIINEIGFDGFRFDASKHVDNKFLKNFIEKTDESSEKNLLFIGESWEND